MSREGKNGAATDGLQSVHVYLYRATRMVELIKASALSNEWAARKRRVCSIGSFDLVLVQEYYGKLCGLKRAADRRSDLRAGERESFSPLLPFRSH